jgi:SAM-dependent methyltransferase
MALAAIQRAISDETVQQDNPLWFYRKHWCSPYREWSLPVLGGLLARGVPANSRVLEIGCGSGEIAGALAGLGYEVTGMDLDQTALEHARAAYRNCQFISGDARTLAMPRQFEAVIALNDEFNRILSPRDLYRAFLNIHAALVEGGALVFDLNLESAYREKWSTPSSVVHSDSACFVNPRFDSRCLTGSANVSMLRLEAGAWSRCDAAIENRCYAASNVRVMLSEAGFRPVVTRVFDEGCDPDTPLGCGRTLFLAVR